MKCPLQKYTVFMKAKVIRSGFEDLPSKTIRAGSCLKSHFRRPSLTVSPYGNNRGGKTGATSKLDSSWTNDICEVWQGRLCICTWNLARCVNVHPNDISKLYFYQKKKKSNLHLICFFGFINFRIRTFHDPGQQAFMDGAACLANKTCIRLKICPYTTILVEP